MEIAVVYDQQEYYVEAAIESDASPSSGHVTLSLELLQFQLFSLVGVAPEEQTLLTSKGELLLLSDASARLLVRSDDERRPRLFLLSAASSTNSFNLPADWSQICTRSAFGDVPVVQPAFQSLSGDGASHMICQACAQTCTTAARPLSPLDWNSSDAVGEQFISEIAVIAGEIDAPAPSGFTKLPVDLNFSAPGDHVYLCVKRGGNRALTQLSVDFHKYQQQAEPSTSVLKQVLSVNCNSGNSSDTAVQLSFDSVFRKSDDELSTFAITDIHVVIGSEQRAPSPAHIRITRNLNAGVSGASVEPIHLWYKVAPLGGFVCDASHSEFGECLFLSRHAGKDVSSIASFSSERITAAMTMTETRKKADEAMLRSLYQHGERSMTSRLQSTLERVRTYESKQMQQEALKHIPVQLLHERARGNESPMPAYQDELVMQLLHWFKRELFSWMNQPKCAACGCANTKAVRTEGPSTPEEVSGEAGRVEVYQCPQCSALTRFPRYNNPAKLLETRTGRCGEWANCFTLCCRAMGFEARYVLDVTDHVWTEVYSEHFKRWLHCDSCEDQLDCPLTYEVGWGKQLSYIFSISHEEIVDSAKRYTQNWDEMRARRTEVSEKWLKTTIAQMNQRLVSALPGPRVEVLKARAKVEQEELERGRTVSTAEVQGRVSGSAEWKNQRSEDGQQQQMSSGCKPTSPSSSEKSSHSAAASLIVELSQQLCKNMLLGCANEACRNPFCLHGSENQSQDMTAHAASSIQLVGSFNQKGFTAASLASLLCPHSPSELRWFILAQRPLLYLPLLDSESSNGTSWLVDGSGNEHHVLNKASCPVRKPFQIPQSGDVASFGVQLLSSQSIEVKFSLPSAEEAYSLSFLARIDLSNPDAMSRLNQVDIFNIVIGRGDITVSFYTSSTQQGGVVCEVRQGESKNVTVEVPSSVLSCGSYAHVGMSVSTSDVKLLINATEVLTLKAASKNKMLSNNDQRVVTLSGPEPSSSGCVPIASAVISHFAVLRASDAGNFADFCKTMKKQFVRARPLLAFRADGPCFDKRCTVEAANYQVGYRVAKVLMWGGDFFDGLQFVYEAMGIENGDSNGGDLIFGPLIGNSHANGVASSPTTELILFADEVITGVSGRKGAWMDSLRLETSFGRQLACGGSGGGDFHVQLPVNNQVRAISLSVGDHLNDPIAFVGEAIASAAAKSEQIEKLRAVLRTNDASQSRSATSAALRYLENITKHPGDDKFKRIRASNAYFVKNVAALGSEASQKFMAWCGFQPLEQETEVFYVFQAADEEAYRCSMDDERAKIHERHAAEAHRRIHFLKSYQA